MKIKNIAFILLAALFLIPVRPAFAEDIYISGKSAILVDVATGKVLYAKNETERMYPASLSKILTALVALEYLSPDELVTVGHEIDGVPYDASKAGHKVGELITVENLIRAAMIKSGNESCHVLAHQVAQRVKDEDEELSYNGEERLFARLMNEKARSLGAINSNFVNSHGYHNPSHYTTAQDMAIISQAALKNDLIASIAKQSAFAGNGAGENPPEGAFTQNYNWESTNQLLSKPEFFYQYATGLKTGFTDQAGQCLAATAEKDGRQLVSVILFSQDPDRWTDSAKLLEYGFDNFSFMEVQRPDEVVDTLYAHNPRLGETGEVPILTFGRYSDLYSEDEFKRITSSIVYNESLIYEYTEEERAEPGFKAEMRLTTPVEEGISLGKINYYLDDELIFSSDIISGAKILERTFNSDVDYYVARAKDAAFSGAAIPYWVGGVLLLVGIFHLIWWNIRRKKRKQFSYRNKF